MILIDLSEFHVYPAAIYFNKVFTKISVIVLFSKRN